MSKSSLRKRQRRSLLDSDEEEDVNPLAEKTRPSNQEKSTGKSLSEALISASTNPQHDDRLFIVHENCKLRIPAEHVVYKNCCFCFVLTFRTILVHNMFCRCCELLKKIYLYIYVGKTKEMKNKVTK